MTTDTTAALEAAILKYGGDAAESYEFHARPPDDRDLKAAIAAHVAAEVARALACAPGVATRWRKVAPLIERLADDVRRRELIARAEFDRRVSDTVTALLAATRETTP